MFLQRRTGSRGLLALLSCLSSIPIIAAKIDMTYCSSFNTGTTSANYDMYQSDGLCRDYCNAQGSYAFAIVKDSNCWCSDYAPDSSVRVDTGSCNQQCPGFPEDTCGGPGLWGYIALNKAPAGTRGAVSSTRVSTTAQASVTTQTVQNTVTYIPPAPSTTSSSSSTSTSSSSTTTTTTTSSSKTEDAVTTGPPSISIATVTAGGEVSLKTVTVIPTLPAGSSGSSAQFDSTPSSGLSTGAAVGIAVGVLGALVMIGGVIVFFCLKKRRQRQEEEMLQRNGSHRGSSSGMMGTPRTEMTGTSAAWEGGEYLPRRNSRMMPHDPRMDPFAGGLYGARQDNRSHESINTIEDNQDYSRKVLRTTNPDPVDG